MGGDFRPPAEARFRLARIQPARSSRPPSPQRSNRFGGGAKRIGIGDLAVADLFASSSRRMKPPPTEHQASSSRIGSLRVARAKPHLVGVSFGQGDEIEFDVGARIEGYFVEARQRQDFARSSRPGDDRLDGVRIDGSGELRPTGPRITALVDGVDPCR